MKLKNVIMSNRNKFWVYYEYIERKDDAVSCCDQRTLRPFGRFPSLLLTYTLSQYLLSTWSQASSSGPTCVCAETVGASLLQWEDPHLTLCWGSPCALESELCKCRDKPRPFLDWLTAISGPAVRSVYSTLCLFSYLCLLPPFVQIKYTVTLSAL